VVAVISEGSLVVFISHDCARSLAPGLVAVSVWL
jgi:hypothetical protein